MAEKKPSNYDEVVDEKTRKKANKAYEDASKIGPGKKPKPPKEMSFNAMYKKSEGLKPAPVEGLDLTNRVSMDDMGMAKGGSASSRADGIASKGKTRGKMC
jgi:hypothetical protein